MLSLKKFHEYASLLFDESISVKVNLSKSVCHAPEVNVLLVSVTIL